MTGTGALAAAGIGSSLDHQDTTRAEAEKDLDRWFQRQHQSGQQQRSGKRETA